MQESAEESETLVWAEHLAAKTQGERQSEHRASQKHYAEECGEERNGERLLEYIERCQTEEPEHHAVLHGIGIDLPDYIVVLHK